MRTFLTLGAALAAASLVVPSQLPAQRNVRRSAPVVRAPEHSATPRRAAPGSVGSSATHCPDGCGDYSLAIVSAVMPSETSAPASNVVTLVIENRGTVAAPISMVSVAPRNHLSLARQSAIPALAPGQRTTIELPVANAPDGNECVSITISPAPVADPATARFLAAVIPDPQVGSGIFGELASIGAPVRVAYAENASPFENLRMLRSW